MRKGMQLGELNFTSTWPPTWANWGPIWATLGPTWANLGQLGPNLEASCTKNKFPNIMQKSMQLGELNFTPTSADLGPTWQASK